MLRIMYVAIGCECVLALVSAAFLFTVGFRRGHGPFDRLMYLLMLPGSALPERFLAWLPDFLPDFVFIVFIPLVINVLLCVIVSFVVYGVGMLIAKGRENP